MITVAYINYWSDSTNDRYFTHFIKHNIGNVKNVPCGNNPDILISSCFGDINKVRATRAKSKLFYYGENLDRYPPYNDEKKLYEIFDMIVGFKNTNIEKKQYRYPLWLMYYNFYNYKPDNNILKHIQQQYDKNIKNKTLFATIIARHDRGGQRTLIYDEINKHGEINSPGNFRNNSKPIGKTSNDKIKYIASSIYNICPENSASEGYFTEKIFQALEGGTIPLYWAISIPEPQILNQNKYCFCNVLELDKLNDSIQHVINNPNQYIEGDIFTENAEKEIKLMYSTLLSGIQNLLCK
jgi:hypothetical protein